MEQNKENTSSVSRTLKEYSVITLARSDHGHRHLCF